MAESSFSVQSVTKAPRTLVSSSLGFSRPGGSDVRSLVDLLTLIQPLGLALYDRSSLRNARRAGEGASYKVSECSHAGSGSVVAVKQIKVPDDLSNDEAFQRRVDCVLKDIEVMHHPPLAEHENILSLLGYGWGLTKGDVLPFIVTEFAQLGTLREYLQAQNLSLQAKLALCSQVACGLNRLHWAGVAHGDLKLENVLVFQSTSNGSLGVYETDLVAKLSDFGHACLFNDDQADGVKQSYRGTAWYQAPELQDNAEGLNITNFLRCDVWALGLLCWEVMAEGCPYYLLPDTETLKRRVWSRHSEEDEFDTMSTQVSHRGQDAFALCSGLADTAIRSINNMKDQSFRPLQDQMIKGILRRTLQVDPLRRPHKVTALPFVFGGGLHSRWNEDIDIPLRSMQLTEDRWSYENFQPHVASTIPHRVKTQILSDAKRAALKNGFGSDRATLQVAFAFANGFGTERDLPLALQSISKSASLGCFPARAILTMVEIAALNSNQQAKAPFFDAALSITDSDLHNQAIKVLSATGQERLRTKCLQLKTASVGSTEKVAISIEEAIQPEQGVRTLLLACKLGDLEAVDRLINEHGIIWPRHFVGPSPLHYLYMFEQRTAVLERVLRMLVPKEAGERPRVLWSHCAEPQIVDSQLPFHLVGTPLDFAVLTGSLETVKVLLAADVLNAEMPFPHLLPISEKTVLGDAIACHQPEIFKLLWKTYARVDPNASLTALHPRHREYLEQPAHHLLGDSLIANLSKKSHLERYVLHRNNSLVNESAMISALIKALQEIFEDADTKSSSINKRSSFGSCIMSGLLKVLKLHDLDMATRIIKATGTDFTKDIRPEKHVTFFESLLDIACAGHLSLKEATAYISFGISLELNLQEHPYFQAAVASIRHYNEALFSHLLLMKSQSFHEVDSLGRGILWHMIDSGFSSVVPLSKVLEIGVEPDRAAHNGEAPLHKAIQEDSLVDVMALIEAGASLWSTTGLGRTVLHIAARSSGTLSLNALLRSLVQSQKPFDGLIEAQDLRYETALHSAAGNLRIVLMQFLLSNGASVNARDIAGNTPFYYALRTGSPLSYDAVELLLKYGADASIPSDSGYPPFHQLALWPTISLEELKPEFLAKYGFELAIADKDGVTLLHRVAQSCNASMIAKLVDTGMDINTVDHENQTPLHYCLHHLEINQKETDRYASFDLLIAALNTVLSKAPDLTIADRKQFSVVELAIQACSTAHPRYSIGQLVEILGSLLDSSLAMEQKGGEMGRSYSELFRSSWTQAISYQHWHAVKEIMIRRQPFDATQLRFPTGAKLLMFAIEHSDVYLMRLFLGDYNFSLNFERINRHREKKFTFPSERSKLITMQSFGLWERSISPSEVHRAPRRELQQVLEFVIENHDIYKMGPLLKSRTTAMPYYWPVFDQLIDYWRGRTRPAR